MKFKKRDDVIEAYQFDLTSGQCDPLREDMGYPDIEPAYAKYIDPHGNVAFSEQHVGWKIKDEFGGLKIQPGYYVIEDSEEVDGFKRFLYPVSETLFFKNHRRYTEITKKQLKDAVENAIFEGWENGVEACRHGANTSPEDQYLVVLNNLINQLDIPDGE